MAHAVAAVMTRITLLATLVLSTTAWADVKPVDDLDQHTLTADEVAGYVAPYQGAMHACYESHARKARRATGELTLRLIVHRNGAVFRVLIDAPGVTGKPRTGLEACIAQTAKTWRFPVRRGFTSAVVPYLFLRTAIPGAGPQPSCWSPKGCPEKRRPTKPATA